MEAAGRMLGRARGRASREVKAKEEQKPGPIIQVIGAAGDGGAKFDMNPKAEIQPEVDAYDRMNSIFKQMKTNDMPPPRGNRPGRFAQPLTLGIVKTRPDSLESKKGMSGNLINVQANYFRLCSVTDWVLYQYHVDFSPEEDRNNVRKALIKDQRSMIGGYLFDGMILYTSHRLGQNPLVLHSAKQDGTKVQMSINYSRQLIFGEHEYMQFFNILMRKCLGALNLQLVGRNYFDPHAKVDMSDHKMELWPGYVTSIRQHESDILMCTEITHKVMRQDTVLDLLQEVQCENQVDWQNDFKETVLGLVVLTDYNNRTYRVDDVDFRVTPATKFNLKNNEEITYAAYYQTRYNINVRNLKQPLLVTKSKSKDMNAGLPETVYLIPELCRMTGLTDKMRNNYKLMSALAEHTRMGPNLRVKKLLAFSQRLNNEPNVVDELNMWNMKVAPQLVNFQARTLPREFIIQGYPGQEISYDCGPNYDWTAHLRSHPMMSMTEVVDWVVMVPQNLHSAAGNFINQVMRAARGMDMKMTEPQVVTMYDDKQATYVNQLEELLNVKNPQLIVCIVTNNRGDRYSAIKKKCSVDRSVASQVITARCLTNKNAQSIALKIAVQINCKLGGSPWTVAIPMKGTMIVGFDVTTDTMNKHLSYGALVATLDAKLTKYFTAVTAHKTPDEASNNVAQNLLRALNKFKIHNEGNLPSRIVVYRDGVGDGQIPYIMKHEVTLLQSRLADVYGEHNYQLAFIVVSKRINTRIFTADCRNPPPGTVVDDCVTLPERYDFFIVSQNVRQGTVSPTSYNVIYDNSGLGPDKIQRLTYKLTHLYYNWSECLARCSSDGVAETPRPRRPCAPCPWCSVSAVLHHHLQPRNCRCARVAVLTSSGVSYRVAWCRGDI